MQLSEVVALLYPRPVIVTWPEPDVKPWTSSSSPSLSCWRKKKRRRRRRRRRRKHPLLSLYFLSWFYTKWRIKSTVFKKFPWLIKFPYEIYFSISSTLIPVFGLKPFLEKRMSKFRATERSKWIQFLEWMQFITEEIICNFSKRSLILCNISLPPRSNGPRLNENKCGLLGLITMKFFNI